MARRRSLRHNHDRGTISLNGSVVDEIGMPSASVYSASKAAVRSFARTLTAELAEAGHTFRLSRYTVWH
jgi:NAD(P)-dependent dehydrogenase (short-subunit alcohol dehydrogenase family)